MDISRLKKLSGIGIVEAADKYEYTESETYDIIDRKLKFAELMKGLDDVAKTFKEVSALVDKLLTSNRAEEKEKAGNGVKNREPAEDRVFQDIKNRISHTLQSGNHQAYIDTIKNIQADVLKLREIQRAEKRDVADADKASKESESKKEAA